MKATKDNFSDSAQVYSKFRPHYPEELYNFIYSQLQNFENAWDCGTGNGQAACELSNRFRQVFATDISLSQLDQAPLLPNIVYSESRAEKTNFDENYFDLITVAQAIHWFDHTAFYKEVERVARPGAVLAVWGYNLLKVNTATDVVINNFYRNIIGSYWDLERKTVDDAYANLYFPFREISSPEFEIRAEWKVEQLIGYLNSWSAVNKYKNANGSNPVELIKAELMKTWGDEEFRVVIFPMFTRIGIIN